LRLETSVRRVFGGYLRGQLILGLVLGVVAGTGAAAFGLPYPVVIGVLAGLFELVPMFGSLLGAIPAVIVALFQPFPTVLWVILFFFIVNQAENYLLAPRITGESLGLTPFYTLLALLLGIEIAGFLGALVAVPVAAVLLDLTKPAEPGPEAIEERGEVTPRQV
jgi:predicted PurR-regulated permease PerM